MDGFIEIPFGAEDSELKGWEYTIPDDMEAEIKNGKIIVRQKENEDEKIRKYLIEYVKNAGCGSDLFDSINTKEAILAYLEKQKEQQPVEKSSMLKTLEEHLANTPKEQLDVEFEALKDLTIDKSAKWSDEDEKNWEQILTYITDDSLKEWLQRRKDVLVYLEKQKEPEDKGEISDGYHTFNELYYYRMLYNAAFFNLLPKEWVHKSKRHHGGEECFGGGWFIVMANLPTGQISNHYELKDWDLFQIPEKDIADEWDGHTPQEAAERIHKYLQEKQGEQKISIFPPGLGEVHFNPVSSKPEEQTHYWKPTKTDVDLFNKAVTTNKALTPTERAQLDIIRFKFGCCRAVNCSGIEQKPVECSDDEKINKCLLDFIKKNSATPFTLYEQFTPQQYIAYLEKQKERGPLTKDEEYTLQRIIEQLEDEGCPQSWKDLLYDIYNLPYDKQEKQEPTEWSKEDEEMINALIRNQEILIDSASNQQLRDTYSKEIQWLKSRRSQPNQEWSKEDEEHYYFVLDGLSYAHADMDRVGSLDRARLVVMGCEWFKRRIKSLRPQSHQPQWKPSEKQTKDLFIAGKEGCEPGSPVANTLIALYVDLKKL